MPAGPRSPVPFLPVAPSIVLVVGVAAAALITLVGIGQLRSQSDASATLRSSALASALSERLRAAASEDRGVIVERAARRSGTEVLLVRQDGVIVADGSLGGFPERLVVGLLVRGQGSEQTRLGRTRFAAVPLGKPLEQLSVLVLTPAPERPFATSSLVRSVGGLTFVLVGVAALVAFAFARDVHGDVSYVRQKLVEMASRKGTPVGSLISVRGADEVGVLTGAFDVLVDRFAAAERAYRQDLVGALVYDRDRSAFLAALSHELRTPLNAILGFADVLLTELDGPLDADARENVEVMRRSAEHLRALIDDVLDLSALESGQLELGLAEVDITALAAEVVREHSLAAQSKHLDLSLRGEPAPAWADAVRVRQIIGNIVGNAIKFTSTGSVAVEVSGDNQSVSVSVTDTGPGIAGAEREGIFEDYQQAGSRESRAAGAGLGLAITRRLVAMHAGHIEVASTLGRGACFTVVLPRTPPPSLGEPRDSVTPPPPGALHGGTA